ncbi:MAG: hypothetical protein DRI34_05035 [Deltaproteobacteria bacterium]|nr:MAG: hypothetical protein DRI34_05035 [Deltaproteobacteria bacterium]
MIRFTSTLYREAFGQLVERWMYNRPEDGDAELLSRLVHFNNVFMARYLQAFSIRLLSAWHGRRPGTRPSETKGELKDFIVRHPPLDSSRVRQLIAAYQGQPGRYYRQTPFHGTIYYLPPLEQAHYLGSSRIKRVRRLAEKSARRITDRVFEVICQHADALAEERARQLGIERRQLQSTPEQMLKEFHRAEERIMELFRRGHPFSLGEHIEINDVAGIKIILPDERRQELVDWLQDQADCRIIEQEEHRGDYNATNLIVAHRPDKATLLDRPLEETTTRLLAARGIDDGSANKAFKRFVNEGEDEVYVEIIVSNYQEMLESEIGRCIHEDRILEQRRQQRYRGPLAKNIEYLMVYMFNFAVSPRQRLDDLPIKLWNRYLPDTIDELIRALFDLPPLSLP